MQTDLQNFCSHMHDKSDFLKNKAQLVHVQ